MKGHTMEQFTTEKNTRLVLGLLKAHGIKKIVASPGTTNVNLIISAQNDEYFEIISAADERSAAYIACGIAEESGKPVVISCTGATASRNYIPGLTEAYYRKLPVIAVTSTLHTGRIGQNFPQQMDRTNQLNDMCKKSVQIPTIHTEEDEWACNVKINEAILESTHNGGGPVHINLVTTVSNKFTDDKIWPCRKITRIGYTDTFPKLDFSKNIAIFIGAKSDWSDELTSEIDGFCEKYNSVVLKDHSSGYSGKYGINVSLITEQESYSSSLKNIDLLIDLGEISGAYADIRPEKVWRVNKDGLIKDKYRKLQYIFEMDEEYFFAHYNNQKSSSSDMSLYNNWKTEYNKMLTSIPTLPFSNEWIASVTANKLPASSRLHLGILNSLRTWNHYEIDSSIKAMANTGGFGIDGCVSTLIGYSLASPNKLCFGVVGDLAFFYDMNSLGNRHIGNNLRLIVVNNGRGTEFRQYFHMAAQFAEKTDEYVAAAGHYGSKSPKLLKHYSEDLGFKYLSASNKEEYLSVLEEFVNPIIGDKSIILEIFTDSKDESDAEKIVRNAIIDQSAILKKQMKSVAKDILPESAIQSLKKFVKR